MDFDQARRRPALTHHRHHRAGAGHRAPRISLLVEGAGACRQDAGRRWPGRVENSGLPQPGMSESRQLAGHWFCLDGCSYTQKRRRPMLDLIGTTLITAAIVVNLNATIMMMPLSSAQRLTAVAIAGLWIGLAIALAGTGAYADVAAPVPAIGVMAGLPLVAAAIAALSSAKVREALMALPVPLLVGLNIMRIFGAFFLLLAAQGRLSVPFPQSAGWGDVIVGVTAVPLTLAVARDIAGQRGALLAWNSVGAGFAASAVWRNDRLGRGHGAAVVEHPGLAGAVLPDHPWLDFCPPGAGEPEGDGLAKAVCEQRGYLTRRPCERPLGKPGGLFLCEGIAHSPPTIIWLVMPGLVPGIHVLALSMQERRGWPGRSPAMTEMASH